MAEEVPRTVNNQNVKRISSDVEDWVSMERNKRGKSSFAKPQDSSSLWSCKNPACRATQSTVARFCKMCSCCLCHKFDSNMDASLWLKCSPDSSPESSCGFSCHVECALRHGKVGNHVLQLQLDGCYICAACGKASSIIGCWKKQIKIAMDTNRVDVLCYKIFLSYRLLNRTSRFRDLHKFSEDLKTTLETELGPIKDAIAKTSRAHTGMLQAASRVQSLCKLAIKKAEELFTSNPTPVSNLNVAEGSVPGSVPRHKSRVDAKSDFRQKTLHKSKRPTLGGEKKLQESCSGAGTEIEAQQPEKLLIPDLNEEFCEPDTTPSLAPLMKCERWDVGFESIVRTIRALERESHLNKEFRLKFLTWFSLKAREHEQGVVRTFVKIMNDDPSGLAEQLLDTFSDIVFCTRLS